VQSTPAKYEEGILPNMGPSRHVDFDPCMEKGPSPYEDEGSFQMWVKASVQAWKKLSSSWRRWVLPNVGKGLLLNREKAPALVREANSGCMRITSTRRKMDRLPNRWSPIRNLGWERPSTTT